MSRRVRIGVLVSVLSAVGLVLSATAAGLYHYTDEELAGPEQPIEFSHAVHAGRLAIDCLYCHTGADKSAAATVPAVSVCMGCHNAQAIGEIASEDEERKKASAAEIQKIRDYCGSPITPCTAQESIPWIRVHWVPEHVQFKHMRHVQAGVDCQRCHGPVETMNRVYVTNDTVFRWPHSLGLPAKKLEMGWCVDCHQANDAWTDCAACHY